MDDYISREAAQKVLCDACGNAACPRELIPRCSFYEKMQSIPAADVRPIMRGEWKTAWLDHDAFGERPMVFYCSACNQIITFRTLFCPNCGADMRKKEEELDER